MANPFYSWQKLLSRVELGEKDLIREVGRDDFENLVTINFQNLEASILEASFFFQQSKMKYSPSFDSKLWTK
jgi:hypothetical protein